MRGRIVKVEEVEQVEEVEEVKWRKCGSGEVGVEK
jgi:hypothetical protein